MDTATQALLGAAVGQAACGHRLGRLRGGVQRFNRRRNGASLSLGDLWRATWGDFSGFELPGAPS